MTRPDRAVRHRPVLHRADVVLPSEGPAILDGAVVERDGLIIAVGTHDELTQQFRDDLALDRREWSGVLIPGLINAHTHLQYTAMESVGQSTYTAFEDWARAFRPLYLEPHDWEKASADGAQRAVRGGTTAVAEIVTNPEGRSAVHDAGLHGVVYWEVIGWKTPQWRIDGEATVIDELERIPTPPHRGLSPHAIYSLDTEVMRDLARLSARLGIRQHIHAAESASEDEYARSGTGELADHWRSFGHGDFTLLTEGGSGRGVIDYLDEVGSLNPHTHLAHGIYVDADDRALLRRRGVAVALCPRSNAVIGLDAPPVADYLNERSAIAVGTDSLSSSPSLSLLEDVAELYRLARAQGYAHDDLHARLFHAATFGGAHALGLSDGDAATGDLRPGLRADMSVFEVSSRTGRDALAELVETGPAHSAATIIAGDIRWDANDSVDLEATHG